MSEVNEDNEATNLLVEYLGGVDPLTLKLSHKLVNLGKLSELERRRIADRCLFLIRAVLYSRERVA